MKRIHAFHLTGAARKPLVEAIEDFTKVKGVYQGAPKFSYTFCGIGVLDRNGALNLDCDLQIIVDLITWLENCGFECSTVTDENEKPDGLTIEMPLTDFTPDKLDNLMKLVKAKENLLKSALGADELPIQQTNEDGGKLQFPWFSCDLDADHVNAYITLVALLCKTAKTRKRITTKETGLDGSPKYAMRCFLLSLGFIGDEYKHARKILLSNLEGNSSWKNGKKAEGTSDEVPE